MKKNKVFLMALSSLSLLNLTTVRTFADVDVTSRADVQFTANDGVVPPIDPCDEEENIDPNKPPTKGPLSINYASNIFFGKQKSIRQEQDFYAKEDTITNTRTREKKQIPNFVQITDLRGTATGWTLSVRQNGPLKKENGVAIVGAQLTLSARSIVPMFGTQGAPSGLTTEQVLSEDGQSHQIVKAEAGTGVSTWNTFLANANDETSSVKLTVPKGAVKETGVYTTTLTWILQDVL